MMIDFEEGDDVFYKGFRWVVMGCSCRSTTRMKVYTLAAHFEVESDCLLEEHAPANQLRRCEN